MAYRELPGLLPELQELTATSFPDGSVDTYCSVFEGKTGYIRDRNSIAERIKENPSCSFRLRPERVEPGGQSVNMAQQYSALGLETKEYGFLDHPVMDLLDFETVSLGTPAEVTICEFSAGAMMFAEQSSNILGWRLSDLEGVEENPKEALSADVVSCANWASIPFMKEELRKLDSPDFNCEVFNFDPGNITHIKPKLIRELFQVLSRLDDDCEVLVHANTEEVNIAAEAFGISGSMEDKLSQLQGKAGVTAYILHDKDRAVAGIKDGTVVVENYEANRIKTRTGAGDRFDAGVGAGRAAGWSWEQSLALGNLCAVNYIEKNQTTTPEAVKEQLEDKL